MKTLLGMQYGDTIPQQYQEGGGVPSAYKASFGLPALRRHKFKQLAYKAAQEEAAAAAKRQKESRFGGAFGGIAGGLLGALLTPLTGGIPLALMAGAGTGLGKLFGSKVGYEGGWEPGMMFRRTKAPEMQDVLYGSEAGMDKIRDAGYLFRMGMGEDALMSGLKSGLMAGFAPGGGLYGKAAKWSEGLGAADIATASQAVLPTASQAVLPTASEAALEAGEAGVGIIDPKAGIDIGKGLEFGRTANPFALSPEQGSQFFSPRGSLLDLTQTGQGFIPTNLGELPGAVVHNVIDTTEIPIRRLGQDPFGRGYPDDTLGIRTQYGYR